MSDIERELKLVPHDPALLHTLANLDALGPFKITGKKREQQRNAYFDTPTNTLRAVHVAFRRRIVAGEPMAIWTLKGEGQVARGVASRTEIELRLDADMAPGLVIGTLRDAARQRGAAVLAEQVADALGAGGLPSKTPFVELEAVRVLRDLETADWRCELALDEVRLTSHPEYAEQEIEVELKHGDDAALDAARAAIEQLGRVSESDGTKLSRALAYIARSAPSSR